MKAQMRYAKKNNKDQERSIEVEIFEGPKPQSMTKIEDLSESEPEDSEEESSEEESSDEESDGDSDDESSMSASQSKTMDDSQSISMSTDFALKT